MKLISHLCVLLCLIYGTVSYKLKSYNGRTVVATIIFKPDGPRLLTNSSLEEQITDFKAGDELNSETPPLSNAIPQPTPPQPSPPQPTPPSPDEAAVMARFIVHYSLWGSLSHISHQPQVAGAPLARVYSISDGPIRASSGVPYFYLTPNDPELQDMFRDPRASLTMTLAQTPYCRMKSYDPEDPRCAQVILTGELVILKNSTSEWKTAQHALFSRHPVMRKWPESHHWVCCKLEINRILVADNFGGNKYPSVDQYFQAHPNFCSQDDPLYQMAFY